MRFVLLLAASFFMMALRPIPLWAGADAIDVQPANVNLKGRFAQAQLLITASKSRREDLTHQASYASSNSNVASVNQAGRLLARKNGSAIVTVTVSGASKAIPVTVSGIGAAAMDFILDVKPILDKKGCASGACHASQYGKGGLKLSVFGFDPHADYEAIARASKQRRINFAIPEASLLLRKPAMQVAHGGGRRIEPGAVEFEVLKAWILDGAPAPRKNAPKVVKLTVSPSHRVAMVKESQQLQVHAHFSDQSVRDVTGLAKYDSTDEGVLTTDARGRVTLVGTGQASVMVRYQGQATIASFVAPYSTGVKLANWKNLNFVDELAAAKFRELGLEPSPLCDDATFVRRAFLDAIGTLPTMDQTREFLDSDDPGKRTQLIDRLLGLTGDPKLDIHNDDYAAFWTLKWSDLIRNNSRSLGEQGMWALHNWIKESLRTNKPFDQFVRELVTAKGSIYSNGPANYFRIHTSATALTEATSQLFLGVRLECAKCHHHPFEKYSQTDYYGLAAFFSRVGTKNSEEFGIFGRESVVMVRSSGEVSHPRTRKPLPPTPLEGRPIDHSLDRRIPLADWLTSANNAFFARSVVNRYVGYLLGRGLVEPIDDLRSTNPPSNAALLDALADRFVKSGFDIKQLIRVIMTSRLYQLRSQPTPENKSDRRFYSHYYVKRLTAEPLLDAIDRVTGDQTKFRNLPRGARAIELPDAEYPNYFLKTFAKPRRASVCECERPLHENLAQALHTLNGEILTRKIASKTGRIARLLKAKEPHDQIVAELYLSALCRYPSEAERELAGEFLKESAPPRECYEDLLWALVNSKQFLFVH